MQIGVVAEIVAGERRVAITPETTKKLVAKGHSVHIQSGAGSGSSITDAAYEAAGAQIADVYTAYECDLVLKVRAPLESEVAYLKQGGVMVGMLNPFDREGLQLLARAGLTSFALEAAPRTSRAQSMDVLSSQANIAGYKAVMIAADKYPRFFPMLMTAAGTVKAARVVILGVGVAGLQAIATAKRLGAVIEASDVRPSVKEQVESLGAKFIDVPYETQDERDAAEGVGGYARPMPPSWLERQKAEVAKRDQTVVEHGVTIVGETNLPSMVAADASALYARNVLDFLKLIVNPEGAFHLDLTDDIVAACLVTQNGEITRN